jgi:hypothetical protein
MEFQQKDQTAVVDPIVWQNNYYLTYLQIF